MKSNDGATNSTSSAEIDRGNHYQDDFSTQRAGGLDEIYTQFNVMQSVVTTMLSRWKERISVETLRPLPTFLGMSGPSLCFSPNAFSPPTTHFDKNTREKVSLRIRLNFAYFLSNYALIGTSVIVIVTLMHPIMIAWVLTIWLMWKIHAVMVESHMPLVVFGYDVGHVITVEIRAFILYLLSLVVTIVYCLVPLLCCFGISAIIILTHSIMRDIQHIEGDGSVYGRQKYRERDEENDDSGEEVIVEKVDAL